MIETVYKNCSSKQRRPYVKPSAERVRVKPEEWAFLRNHPELVNNPAFWDSSVALSPALEQVLAQLLARRKEESMLDE